MRDEKRLTRKEKFGYGFAAIGDSASYSFVSAFSLFFLTTVAGVPAVSAGIITSIGGIWNGIWSPIIGYLTDKSASKYGRRRPYMLIGAFLVSGAIIFLFTSITAGDAVKTIYYSVMTVLFWSGFSVFFIPYLALGAELTDDYNERTVLRSFASAFNHVGSLIGMVAATFIVAILTGKEVSIQSAWQCAGIVVAIVTFFSILGTWRTTRGAEKNLPMANPRKNKTTDRSVPRWNILREYLQVIKLKPLKYLVAGSILYLAANTLNISGRMYFLSYNMGLSKSEITLVYLFVGVVGILVVPAIIKTSGLFGKRTVFMVGVLLSCVVVVISGIRGMHTFPELFVFLFFVACGNGCYWQLFPSMIYDICEVDEFVYGQRREGIVVSIQSLSEALSAGVTVFVLSIILDRSGFDNQLTMQSAGTLQWISHSITFIPAVCMVLSVFCVFLYPLTQKRFDLLKDALEKKANGEAYDRDALNKLI
ncbi:MAG: MFS transporter [Clostridiales Family XIII bacterium]|nr:MFS transporter [Clostridiales Family XIII bacterium]